MKRCHSIRNIRKLPSCSAADLISHCSGQLPLPWYIQFVHMEKWPECCKQINVSDRCALDVFHIAILLRFFGTRLRCNFDWERYWLRSCEYVRNNLCTCTMYMFTHYDSTTQMKNELLLVELLFAGWKNAHRIIYNFQFVSCRLVGKLYT